MFVAGTRIALRGNITSGTIPAHTLVVYGFWDISDTMDDPNGSIE